MKYRKKPVVVEAFRLDAAISIPTLEGVMRADPGDYIIIGVNGEKYPCKADVFHKTYEKVEEARGMNNMGKFAKMIGVEVGEEFKLSGCEPTFRITDDGVEEGKNWEDEDG